MRYPVTEILKPRPISKGTLENKARRATDLEFTDERSDVKSEIPSPLAADIFEDLSENQAGASGSIGEDLYIMSYFIVNKEPRAIIEEKREYTS